jgi:hypothetical protein
MDQVALVEDQIADGKRLADQLARDGFPMTAAFWLRTREDGQWFLYLVSPVVDSEGHRGAYRRIYDVMPQMSPPLSIHPFEVKVVRPSSSVAEAVGKMVRRLVGKGGFYRGYDGDLPGGVSIEGAYLYPPSTTVPTGPTDG